MSRVASWRPIAAWIAGFAPLAAQGVAWTTASPPVAATLSARLSELAEGWRLEARPAAELWRSIDAGEGLACDLLLAVDLELVAHAGRNDLLRRVDWPEDPLAVPFHRDTGGRYVAPWAMPWRAVWDARRIDSDRDPPRSLSAFGRLRHRQSVALPDPWSAPGWFAGWVRDGLRQGGASLAFRALLDVDRSVKRWCGDPVEALALLRADPEVEASCVPLALLRELDPAEPFESADLEPFAVAQGLALAVVEGGESLPAEVLRALLAPDLALELMRAHGMLPGIHRDAVDDPAELPADLLTTLENLAPLEPGRGEVGDWLARFDTEVRGQAAERDDLRLLIELAFLSVGISLIVWIRRRTRDASSRPTAP